MEFEGMTFRGPEIDDFELLGLLPPVLQEYLRQTNGLVVFDGGFHVRGVCREPAWHSLSTVWTGSHALHRWYPEVQPNDIPFAADCVGDQFLLRNGIVHRLYAEDGRTKDLGLDLPGFLASAAQDPVGFLMLQPLLQLRANGHSLKPGQAIHVYPPLCTKEAAQGVSMKPVSALDCLAYHARLAEQLSKLRIGEKARFTVKR